MLLTAGATHHFYSNPGTRSFLQPRTRTAYCIWSVAPLRSEKRYLHESGKQVLCHLTVSLVRNADGTPKYFIRIIEDSSARQEAEAMLGCAAHELRSPLSHIKGFVGTLQRRTMNWIRTPGATSWPKSKARLIALAR
jgi:hypothetical protein